MNPVVYTIGHSKHSEGEFVRLLRGHEVTAVADVRSSPYSRFNPQFNRELIQGTLRDAGVAYVFLGEELGARAKERGCYVGGKVSYALLARTAAFQQGLERVAQGAQTQRIALMCAEMDPLMCHRTILVARHLAGRGLGVQHILEDGQIESHDAAVARLLVELHLPERDLFRGREEIVEEAYRRRGEQIAYAEESGAAGEGTADGGPAGAWR